MQIVQALEALSERRGEVSLDLAGLRVEQHQAALVVGDEDPAALVDLQPVRPAVVLNDKLPFSFRVDPEYAPEGNVHAPQVSLAVERGTFEEAVHLRSAAVGVGPRGAALLAELRGQRSVRPRLDAFDFLERVVHGKTPGGDAKHNPTRGKPAMRPRNARQLRPIRAGRPAARASRCRAEARAIGRGARSCRARTPLLLR